MNSRRSHVDRRRSTTRPAAGDVVEEVVERVVATGPEAGDDPAAVAERRAEVAQHLPASRRIEESHHVAGADHHVETLVDAAGAQVEFGEIADEPRGTRMIVLGGGDQHRVEIDAHHLVAELRQPTADAARATTGVEDPCPPGDHGVDESGLAVQIDTVGGHRAEAFDVPARVVRVLLDLLDPAVADRWPLRHRTQRTGLLR